MSARQLVRITWQDAEYESGWIDLDDRHISKPVVVTAYVAEITEEYVELTMTEHGDWFHMLRIYLPMIEEWEELEIE